MDVLRSLSVNGSAGMRGRYAARHAFWLLLVLAMPGGAQVHSRESDQATREDMRQRLGAAGDGYGSPADILEEKQLRALNIDRQKTMVSDANKLLRLAFELNAEVASANPTALTPAQLKKVAEIEKLARSVKTKMMTSVRGMPPPRDPFSIIDR